MTWVNMKKSINIYKRIVSETEVGYFIVYYIDKEDETYEEVIRFDESIFKLDGELAHELFSGMEIFDKIQDSLIEGLYFCVYKSSMGSDWFTKDTSNPSLKNPVLSDSN